MKIPALIDDYSPQRNGVDLANQCSDGYKNHKPRHRTWLPTPYWFIDISIISAYRICYTSVKPNSDIPPISHLQFRDSSTRRLSFKIAYIAGLKGNIFYERTISQNGLLEQDIVAI